jgi:hypothetical protein
MPLNKQILASIAANCERYIGTQGGGMDQAIAFLAQKGMITSITHRINVCSLTHPFCCRLCTIHRLESFDSDRSQFTEKCRIRYCQQFVGGEQGRQFGLQPAGR